MSRSVTRASPPGRNAIAHGTDSPVTRSRGVPSRGPEAGGEAGDADDLPVDPPDDPPDEHPASARAHTMTSVLSLTSVNFPSQFGTKFFGPS
ncbi:hypothetical protein Airi02_022090 [Actinoallomurus iriomotensis]|uniref:Uncharacterized protein n=1 Tax=Actinoallomurus iriomotensis TaxID=478107 RepID=A0A9W6S2L8_9ACTN|nr:hypothetical protein Airi02_022090 [Actinoallomurus iriomotensis]